MEIPSVLITSVLGHVIDLLHCRIIFAYLHPAVIQTLWRLLLADQWSHDERLNHGPICFRGQTSLVEEDLLAKLNANTTLAACLGRKLFQSSRDGYRGLAPPNANVGDRICGLI